MVNTAANCSCHVQSAEQKAADEPFVANGQL